MPGSYHPRQNRLLAALTECDAARLGRNLELVALQSGEVLYESGTCPRQVYFPLTCIVSLRYVMQDGASAEIAVVGNDGVLGIAVFMGGQSTPSRAVVQSPGHAYRLDAAHLKAEFARAGSLPGGRGDVLGELPHWRLPASWADWPGGPSVAIWDASGQLAYVGPYSDGASCNQDSSFIEPVLRALLAGRAVNAARYDTLACLCELDEEAFVP